MNIQQILERIRWNAEDGGHGGGSEPPPADNTSGGSGADGGTSGDGPETTAPPSWIEGLSDEGRQLVQTKGWGNPSDAVAGYTELEKIVGADRIALPGENATQEELDKFYTALGRPETPDEYDLDEFSAPEGVPWDAENQQAAMAMFHKAGMTSAQAQACLQFEAQRAVTMQEAINKRCEEAVTTTTSALQKKWGGDFAANMDMANIGMKQVLGSEDAGLVDVFRTLRTANGEFLGDTEGVIEVFQKIGRAFMEPHALAGIGSQPGNMGSPAAAKAEIDKLRSDSGFQAALGNRNHPEHQAAVDRKTRLFQAAYPGGNS